MADFLIPLNMVSVMVGDVAPRKELHWLLSIVSGIVLCKVVYDLTGIVSALCFKGYGKLSDAKKTEWNDRGISTVHAIIVSIASLYLLIFSDLFEDNSGIEFINRSSKLSNTVFGMSIGYFLADLAMILWCFPVLGGLEYILHHGLSMHSLILSLTSGQAQFYILMTLFTEVTTPFVNLRWYLDVAGQKSSKLYILNGIALFVGWLVARVLLFIYFFAHMVIHFDQVKKVFPLGFYSLLTVPPVLAMMNSFWFWKISKGLIKTLKKTKHSQ